MVQRLTTCPFHLECQPRCRLFFCTLLPPLYATVAGEILPKSFLLPRYPLVIFYCSRFVLVSRSQQATSGLPLTRLWRVLNHQNRVYVTK
ncbi:uncharacterized protein BT62DRAFT_659823 [Guyanagaster necrorhizus]|uniref:Uncharacterized protein n=1 Tax=Guyanagaster necrorhizus TaxID=856835 RepID=A0A9P8AV07_9AGAR|nr:uncharacterized protein BT62DRAFT_659823 [Guyanagaster necrorhizus MCA 3950]KAG7449044.1 hypothetical protein BT62DRAFT_659823 [Guyanagaster necrorhizus MCA 3950]